MTFVLVLVLALLCGVSIGTVIGLALGWFAFRNHQAHGEIDYSGGM